MRINHISLAVLATVFAASCSNEQIVETNADPIGEAIDFRPSVASPTRAVITTIGNLGDFNVLAKGYHSTNGTLYRTFMIGEYDEHNNLIPGYAEKTSEAMWKLTKNVYWPTDVNNAVFWAFTDRTTNDVDDENNKIKLPNGTCVTCGTVEFNSTTGPYIRDYTPLKADLGKSLGQDNGWFDGDSQRDFVSAFSFQDTRNPHINLQFRHLLSQIEVNAMSKHSIANVESRHVKIRGAWIVNAISSGSLNARFNSATNADDPIWELGSSKESYGTYYADSRKIQVSTVGTPTINIFGVNGHGNLMLIPQTVTQWNGSATTTTNAYLLLLCRVDLGHKGEVTVDPENEAVSETKDGVHYHQQFPVMTRYDENAYGLTAVPLPINWERGKKYTYNLNICGENTGAGQYPPNIPTDNATVRTYLEKFIAGNFKVNGTGCDDMDEADRKKVIDIITTIPENKTVGSYVLDDPIDFTVTVSDWETGDTWTNGNDKTNTVSE